MSATDPARLTTPERTAEDADAALRPKSLDEFIGQQAARENLRIFVNAARSRGEALDHVLFFGPPGLGKTTLAGILGSRNGCWLPRDLRAGDRQIGRSRRTAHQSRGRRRPVHRRDPSAQSGGRGSALPGDGGPCARPDDRRGPSARSVRIDLPRFTLIGATTRQGLLTTPLRDRFGIPVRLNFYSVEELEQVVRRGARLLSARPRLKANMKSRGAAGGRREIAGRLLRRVRDFAHAAGADSIDAAVADRALTRLEIDRLGLDAMDRRYLTMIADLYGGGPVGIETLAAGLSEPRDTLEDVVEPFLIQLGLIARTARGPLPQRPRLAAPWPYPPAGSQSGLFDPEEK